MLTEAEAETEEGLWGCTVGRTGEADKTSLHCDWAASAGAGTTTKPSKRAKLHRMPKVGQSGGAAGWSWGGKAKILLAKTGWDESKSFSKGVGPCVSCIITARRPPPSGKRQAGLTRGMPTPDVMYGASTRVGWAGESQASSFASQRTPTDKRRSNSKKRGICRSLATSSDGSRTTISEGTWLNIIFGQGMKMAASVNCQLSVSPGRRGRPSEPISISICRLWHLVRGYYNKYCTCMY